MGGQLFRNLFPPPADLRKAFLIIRRHIYHPFILPQRCLLQNQNKRSIIETRTNVRLWIRSSPSVYSFTFPDDVYWTEDKAGHIRDVGKGIAYGYKHLSEKNSGACRNKQGY